MTSDLNSIFPIHWRWKKLYLIIHLYKNISPTCQKVGKLVYSNKQFHCTFVDGDDYNHYTRSLYSGLPED